MKENRNNKLGEIKAKRMNKEEYAYDFVPELSHTLNIDEQREEASRLEHITEENNNK